METVRPKLTIIPSDDNVPVRKKKQKKVRDFSNTRYVSPVKFKPRELAWKLYKENGTRYK
jgi:hypothetical protein